MSKNPIDDWQPPCMGLNDLFFGPGTDGREEQGRAEREAVCKNICGTCPIRIPCLETALIYEAKWGVWGGMGEGERKAFVAHLKEEGYTNQVPEGNELLASIRSFYKAYIDKKFK